MLVENVALSCEKYCRHKSSTESRLKNSKVVKSHYKLNPFRSVDAYALTYVHVHCQSAHAPFSSPLTIKGITYIFISFFLCIS